MTQAQTLAQQLFDKAVEPIMDLPLTDEVIKAKGIEIASIMLGEIYDRNFDEAKNDLYGEVHAILMNGDIEY